MMNDKAESLDVMGTITGERDNSHHPDSGRKPVRFTSEWTWLLLRDLLDPYKKVLLVGVLVGLTSSAFALCVPWLAGRFTDVALMGRNQEVQGPTLLLLLLASFFVQAALTYYGSVLLSDACERLAMSVKEQVYRHLQKLPLLTISHYGKGDLLNLFERDAINVADFFIGTLASIPTLVLTFFGSFVLTLFINPVVAVMAVLLLPIFFILVRLLGRDIRPVINATFDEMARAMSLLEENLSSLKLIKSTGSEDAELARYEAINQDILKLNQRNLRLGKLLAPLVRLSGASAIVLLLWVSVEVGGADQSIGELISLLLYGMLMINPVSVLASTYAQYQSTRASVTRIAEVTNFDLEAYALGDTVSLGKSPSIEFRDVWFGYDKQKPILKGLNLVIRSGETVLITGNNGAGKSTLVDLLCRFIEPDRGDILIDGVNIRQMSLSALRRQIGLVYQESHLMNRSIRENINYGHAESLDFPDGEMPGILDFIETLDEGCDTQIVEKGSNLSGGQKQRVSLARILINQQSIVVLDEAMSMQDPSGEKQFMEEVQARLGERTVLIVSHNDSLLGYADRLINIDSGAVSHARTNPR